jgi:hypothetical protein
MSTPEEVLYDVRLIDRHIQKGKTTRKDVQKWLKTQEDLSEQAHIVDYESLTATGALKIPRPST